MSTKFKCQKTVLFQTIQFSISTLFNSIWSIDKTLSYSTIPSESRLESDGNEGELHIPHNLHTVK